MTRLKAPEGYKYRDKHTGKLHSEVITNDKNRYELVPDTTEQMTTIIGG